MSRKILEKQKTREDFFEFLLCYSTVTKAVIAEKVEQFDLDIRKMHDQACECIAKACEVIDLCIYYDFIIYNSGERLQFLPKVAR